MALRIMGANGPNSTHTGGTDACMFWLTGARGRERAAVAGPRAGIATRHLSESVLH